GHPLARATRLEAADFRGQALVAVRREVGPAVFDRITTYFSRAGVAVPISQSATSSISLIGLVAAGAGIGFVVESLRCIRRDDVRYVELSGDAPTLGYSLCHRPDLPDALRVSFERAVVEVGAAAAASARGTAVEP
ncbi:MAG: LysR family substrate-binding domain-containing protein, partial [Rhizobiales bacterium]|nr:LysR family substrate-binding domain-containing protein [Rhizobacter sp.]